MKEANRRMEYTPSLEHSQLLASDSDHHWHGTTGIHCSFVEELQGKSNTKHMCVCMIVELATPPTSSIHDLIS